MKRLKFARFIVLFSLILFFQNCSDEGFRSLSSSMAVTANIDNSTTTNTVPGGPVVTAKSLVPANTNQQISSFEFEVNAQATIKSIECSLDANPKTPCTNLIFSFPSLQDGAHQLTITATDVNNKTGELKIATLIDTTKPLIKINSAPATLTRDTGVKIDYEIVENGSGVDVLTCTLDGKPINSCASPLTFSNMAPGKHKFSILAKDKTTNLGQGEVTWDFLVGPKKILTNYFVTCAMSSNDDLVCIPNSKFGVESPKIVSSVGKIKEADGCYYSVGVIKKDGNFAGHDSRYTMSTDVFLANSFIPTSFAPSLNVDKLSPSASGLFFISNNTNTASVNVGGSSNRFDSLDHKFRVIDASCAIYTDFPAFLKSDGSVSLDFFQPNGPTLSLKEKVIALAASSTVLRQYFLTESGVVLGQDFERFGASLPAAAIENFGKLDGAKDIKTDKTDFACFIGPDDLVSCSTLVKNSNLNLVKPQNLGPVRQIVGDGGISGGRFCALTIDGKVKCWTKANMSAQEIVGF